MSMHYSKLATALNFFSTKKILVFCSKAYIKEKFIKNKVILKSLKKESTR